MGYEYVFEEDVSERNVHGICGRVTIKFVVVEREDNEYLLARKLHILIVSLFQTRNINARCQRQLAVRN